MNMTFDLTTIYNERRPLSWSAISSFQYDPQQWYRKYKLGQEDPATKEMLFGSKVGQLLASDPSYLPHVPRYPVYEYELRFYFFDIPMIGFIDGWNKRKLKLGEYKTGKKPWTQKRAKDHGQLKMYDLGLWDMHKIKPDDIQHELHWLPTKENGDFSISLIDEKDCKTFLVRNTMAEMLQFGTIIRDVYNQMEQFCSAHV